MRQAVLVHASWPLLLAEAAGRPHRRTTRWAGAWLSDRGALANPVVLLQPLDDPGTRLAEIARLVPDGVPYLLISPWPTEDLTRHGLVLVGHPPLMARLPSASPAPPAGPQHLEVREVLDPEQLAIAEQVLVEGYPMPEVQPLHAAATSSVQAWSAAGLGSGWPGTRAGPSPSQPPIMRMGSRSWSTSPPCPGPAAWGRAPRSRGRRRCRSPTRPPCSSPVTTADRSTSGWDTSPSRGGQPGCAQGGTDSRVRVGAAPPPSWCDPGPRGADVERSIGTSRSDARQP